MLDKLNDFVAEPLPRKILFFDNFLTPGLIRTLYWLGLLAVLWTGLGHFFSNGFFGLFEAVVYVFMGAIALRVMAELVMLLFKINENLELVAANTTQAEAEKEAVRAASKPKKKVTKKASKKVAKKTSRKTPESEA